MFDPSLNRSIVVVRVRIYIKMTVQKVQIGIKHELVEVNLHRYLLWECSKIVDPGCHAVRLVRGSYSAVASTA